MGDPNRRDISLQWQRLVAGDFGSIDDAFLASFRAPGPLNRFAGWNPADGSTRYFKLHLQSVARRQPPAFFDAYRRLGDTSIGSPATIREHGCDISADYLAAVEEWMFLHDSGGLDDVTRVIEIGAGFGRTCHALLRLAPQIDAYTIVDLAPMLTLSRAYLARAIPDRLDRIRFIAHDDRDAQASIEADLSINIDSFQEMPPAAIDDYMRRLIVRTPRFYSRNPIAKYDPADVGLPAHPPSVADVFDLGYCRERIDIFDEDVLSKQRDTYLSSYRPPDSESGVFECRASRPMELFPFYQHALYQCRS